MLARTGYTGERGYELFAPGELAADLWGALPDAGRPFDIVPCGLGARDVLRLEMGYPLYGQDLVPDRTSLEAGMGWAVAMDKGGFVGREALARQAERGLPSLLRGPAHVGPPAHPPRASARASGRRGRRRGHERDVLAAARPRDRARVPLTAAMRSTRVARSRSTSAAGRRPPPSFERPSSIVRRGDGPRRRRPPGEQVGHRPCGLDHLADRGAVELGEREQAVEQERRPRRGGHDRDHEVQAGARDAHLADRPVARRGDEVRPSRRLAPDGAHAVPVRHVVAGRIRGRRARTPGGCRRRRAAGWLDIASTR